MDLQEEAPVGYRIPTVPLDRCNIDSLQVEDEPAVAEENIMVSCCMPSVSLPYRDPTAFLPYHNRIPTVSLP